jgi:hypothetical protein
MHVLDIVPADWAAAAGDPSFVRMTHGMLVSSLLNTAHALLSRQAITGP